ncbi:hypothetical protein XENOCAPTIV_020177 [Xenoophorus captivus]|uniref:Uncharacterized protein n=1 Tax=Xenoophorus captivus TaxID=1517983 RepID=A0ABV0SIA8_9TELE
MQVSVCRPHFFSSVKGNTTLEKNNTISSGCCISFLCRSKRDFKSFLFSLRDEVIFSGYCMMGHLSSERVEPGLSQLFTRKDQSYTFGLCNIELSSSAFDTSRFLCSFHFWQKSKLNLTCVIIRNPSSFVYVHHNQSVLHLGMETTPHSELLLCAFTDAVTFNKRSGNIQ